MLVDCDPFVTLHRSARQETSCPACAHNHTPGTTDTKTNAKNKKEISGGTTRPIATTN